MTTERSAVNLNVEGVAELSCGVAIANTVSTVTWVICTLDVSSSYDEFSTKTATLDTCVLPPDIAETVPVKSRGRCPGFTRNMLSIV